MKPRERHPIDPASPWRTPLPPPASIVFLALPAPSARAAVAIQEVRSAGGVTAWLVEDYTVPIVAIRFAFEGGSDAGPGRQGRPRQPDDGPVRRGRGRPRQRGLPDQARRRRRRDALRRRPRRHFYGSMRMLAEQRDGRRSACSAWRHHPAALRPGAGRPHPRPDRCRHRRRSSAIPDRAAQVAWSQALYGDHPYARRDEGTEATLAVDHAATTCARCTRRSSRAARCMWPWSAPSMPRR